VSWYTVLIHFPNATRWGAIMDAERKVEGEQAVLWNGAAGEAWVEAQDTLDRMLKPHEDLLLEVPFEESARTALDVGCGTGSTTLAVARRLGANAQSTGIDISEPMLAAARARAERDGMPARFILGDVQRYAFEPASFDAIVSRFGVMFFDDPVRAFTNLRGAARSNAELRFITWRSPEENPFMTAAERAAAPLLPNMPSPAPDAPGRFSFADPHRVLRILEEGGWTEIEIRPVDVGCAFPEKELAGYATRFGPLSRILHELDEHTRTTVADAVRAAFDPFVVGAEVRFDAACWMVGARAP
jgi:SAM-dependent methyltransferase